MNNNSNDGLLSCSRLCIQDSTACTERVCRHWIDYTDEFNCTLISVYKNGRMTLREAAQRLGISFSRVKQIEMGALSKIKKRLLNSGVLF
jgi:hypothetical protein